MRGSSRQETELPPHVHIVTTPNPWEDLANVEKGVTAAGAPGIADRPRTGRPMIDDPRLAAALGALDEDDRELLLLIAWDDLPRNEITQILRCSDAALRVRIHRARRRFREALEAGAPTPADAGNGRRPSRPASPGRRRPLLLTAAACIIAVIGAIVATNIVPGSTRPAYAISVERGIVVVDWTTDLRDGTEMARDLRALGIVIGIAPEDGEPYTNAAEIFEEGEVLGGLTCALGELGEPLTPAVVDAQLARLGQDVSWLRITEADTSTAGDIGDLTAVDRTPTGSIVAARALDADMVEVTVAPPGSSPDLPIFQPNPLSITCTPELAAPWLDHL